MNIDRPRGVWVARDNPKLRELRDARTPVWGARYYAAKLRRGLGRAAALGRARAALSLAVVEGGGEDAGAGAGGTAALAPGCVELAAAVGGHPSAAPFAAGRDALVCVRVFDAGGGLPALGAAAQGATAPRDCVAAPGTRIALDVWRWVARRLAAGPGGPGGSAGLTAAAGIAVGAVARLRSVVYDQWLPAAGAPPSAARIRVDVPATRVAALVRAMRGEGGDAALRDAAEAGVAGLAGAARQRCIRGLNGDWIELEG